MQQAGINIVTFYEDNGISITYNSSGEITSLSSTGDTLEFTECLYEPKLEFECEPGQNNIILWNYMIKAILMDISQDTYDKLERLIGSIYGWKPKIEMKSGETIFLNDLFFAISDDLNTNESHVYFLELKPRKISNNKPIFYN